MRIDWVLDGRNHLWQTWMMWEHSPNRAALHEVADRLKVKRIQFALGGSGLLFFYGCTTEIHDWDITTDASVSEVESAISGLVYKRIESSGIFATRCLFKIELLDTVVDLIVGFAIKFDEGIYRVPTLVTDYWDGIPVGDPQVWIKVYDLLGRQAKANLLRGVLSTIG